MNDIVSDSSGYLYIVGTCDGGFFGEESIDAPDCFIIKFISGTHANYIWTKIFGSDDTDYGYGITIDKDNNI